MNELLMRGERVMWWLCNAFIIFLWVRTSDLWLDVCCWLFFLSLDSFYMFVFRFVASHGHHLDYYWNNERFGKVEEVVASIVMGGLRNI